MKQEQKSLMDKIEHMPMLWVIIGSMVSGLIAGVTVGIVLGVIFTFLK